MSEREECGYCGRTEGEGHGPDCPDRLARAASQERPQPDELLRDLVQHWDAGDLDHDFDALSSAFDSAREYVGRSIVGEHRHPLASQERPSIDVERDALQTAINVYDATPVHEIDEETIRAQEGRIIIAARDLLARLSGPVGE